MFKHLLLYVWIALAAMLAVSIYLPNRDMPAVGQRPSQSESGGQRDEAKNAPAAAERDAIAPVAQELSEQRTRSKDKQPECNACSEHEKADLYEQRRMAKAAERQTAINAVGAVLVAFSLIFTGWAAYAAAQAARAAREAVGAERAWMTYVGQTNMFIENGRVDGEFVRDGLAVSLKWQNTGRSPALRVSVFVRHRLVDFGDDDVPVFEPPDADTGYWSLTLGPAMPANTMPVAFNDEQHNRLRERRSRLFVYSKVTYRDAFDPTRERHSEVCGEVTYNGERMDEGRRVPNIGFQPRGQQNTAT